MNFDSPDVAKDFPGLYGEEQHCKSAWIEIDNSNFTYLWALFFIL